MNVSPAGLRLVTDGASRGNPGHAGAGYVITDGDGRPLAQHAECIGITTNNEAEYHALILGLEAVQAFATEGELQWFSDSKLLVDQISGDARISKDHLKALYDEAKRAKGKLILLPTHVRRTDPRIAAVDRLVNQALDQCPNPAHRSKQ